jgi:NADH dehydrogenase
MILVTGGTGFIGRVLIRQLAETGLPVRTLIRPSKTSPELPHGVAVEVAVSSLNDPRGLRAAMVGVDTVYHLASGEWKGPRASLLEIDIQGTRAVVEAAADAGVKRFFYLSHLGADRASAYPVMKAKGIAEDIIRRSGLEFTIIRSAVAFGPGDGLTTGVARMIGATPFIYLIPGDGKTLLQPIWVEDLATCLVWALDDNETRGRTYDIGGPEYLPFRQIVEMIMAATGMRRQIFGLAPPYLRWITIALEAAYPNLPVTVYWLDYLAVNRTTALDQAPRAFNLIPSRMALRLDYLKGRDWRRPLWRLPSRQAG